jgi:hypothetical protein
MSTQTTRTNGSAGNGEAKGVFPRLAFYRANPQGTGSVAQIELKLDRTNDRGSCLFLSMARQLPPEAPGEGRATGRFDWNNRATVKLGFGDTSEILAVLEGRQPQAGGEKGLYHQARGMNTIITFKRREDGGYWLGLSRRNEAKEPVFKAQIGMGEAEGVGLRCALSGVMPWLAFFPFERPARRPNVGAVPAEALDDDGDPLDL